MTFPAQETKRNSNEGDWLTDYTSFFYLSLSASVSCALQSWPSHFRRPVKSWVRAVCCRTRRPCVHSISSFVDIEVNCLANSTEWCSLYCVVNHRKFSFCLQHLEKRTQRHRNGMVCLVIVILSILWYIYHIFFIILAHFKHMPPRSPPAFARRPVTACSFCRLWCGSELSWNHLVGVLGQFLE